MSLMEARIAALRRMYPQLTKGKTDGELVAVLQGADIWINGRKWSATIVAANYLEDGEYHP